MLEIIKYYNNYALHICPSCKSTLVKSPKRKCLCPICSQTIYYRKDPDRQIDLLLNESDLTIFELYKKSYFTLKCTDSAKKSLLLNSCSDIEPFSDQHEIYCKENEPEHIIKYIYPLLLNSLKKHISNGDVGLYCSTLYYLGFIYAYIGSYKESFNYFCLHYILLVQKPQNNMHTLNFNDLNYLPDNTCLYIDYDPLFSIFFMLKKEKFTLKDLQDEFINISLDGPIKYKYNATQSFDFLQETLSIKLEKFFE